jgi:hypothetical protein|nr:hypothetical protein [Candidatus Krumholzibacteria bacterium]
MPRALWICTLFGGLLLAANDSFSQNMVFSSTEDLRSLAGEASLILVGRVDSDEYFCINDNRAYAELSVTVEETWLGNCEKQIQITVPGVHGKGIECARLVDPSSPPEFIEGERYLFICHSPFDFQLNAWGDSLRVPYGGVLEISENGEEIQFFGDKRQMEVENSVQEFREVLASISPVGLIEQSDLVVVLSGIKVKGQSSELNRELVTEIFEGRVLREIKGKADSNTIEIDPRPVQGIKVPRVSSSANTVLFLKRMGESWRIVAGPRGCLVLNDQNVLQFAGRNTGWILEGTEIKKYGVEN